MKKSLLIVSTLFLVTSCGATTSNGVSPGLLFNAWSDRDPISRVDNSVSDSKSGSACVSNIFYLFTVGNSSIESAKEDGGIKNVAYVERTFSSFFGVYQKGCTVVKGN